MMSRRYYSKESPEFAAALATSERAFRPRFHFIYTEREAEQDAYYWFMKGIESARLDALKILEDRINGKIAVGR